MTNIHTTLLWTNMDSTIYKVERYIKDSTIDKVGKYHLLLK